MYPSDQTVRMSAQAKPRTRLTLELCGRVLRSLDFKWLLASPELSRQCWAMLSFLRDFFGGVRKGAAQDAIASDDAMVDFIATRAAHVCQTALYGYLQKRMGTRSREIFQDPMFAEPLGVSREAMLVHCLSDLTIFAVAEAVAESGLDSAGLTDLAERWFRDAYRSVQAGVTDGDLSEAVRDLRDRASRTDWARAAEREGAFTASPQGLVDCAPVIDDLKDLDAEIVRNSVRFRWTDVRRQFRERVDRAAFAGLR